MHNPVADPVERPTDHRFFAGVEFPVGVGVVDNVNRRPYARADPVQMGQQAHRLHGYGIPNGPHRK